MAVLNAIVPHDSESDRRAVRLPCYLITIHVVPALTPKSFRAVAVQAGEVYSRGAFAKLKLHRRIALVLPYGSGKF
jgi:hypothetical protein